MSEFKVEVVQLGKIDKHPNADRLEMTVVNNGYPVISQAGLWKEGDLAVYVPVDAIVPVEQERWAFLTGHGRIRAKRLLGIFSMGLITKPEPDWKIGQDVQAELGITKWEPELDLHTTGDTEQDPGFLPVYDIEGLRKYPNVLKPGEEVVVTEKIHGANARFAFHRGRFWAASRTQFKKADANSIWWRAAKTHELEKKLSQVPGFAIYGEVYGQVQDLKYSVDPKDGVLFRAFDVRDITKSRWLDYKEAFSFLRALDIPMVPELYKGPWDMDRVKPLSEGNTKIGSMDHVREGIVIKPTIERYDETIGRVILKLHGEGFLLRK